MRGILALLFFSFLFGKVITSIKVLGNENTKEQFILKTLNLSVGEEFNLENLQRGIKRLYKTGYYGDIEVYKEEDERGIRLLVKVEELPLISKVKLVGVEKINLEELIPMLGIETEYGESDTVEKLQTYYTMPDLEELLGLYKEQSIGRILSLEEIEAIRKRIERIYESRGYPNTKVDYKIVKKVGGGELIFYVREGSREYTEDVEFVGNKAFSDWELGGKIILKGRNIFLFRFHPPYSDEMVEYSAEKLKEFYRSEGFLDVKVSYKVVKRRDGSRKVIFYINEGKRYKLKAVKIFGNTLYSQREILGELLKGKRYFREETLKKIYLRILDLYSQIGFINVLIRREVEVDRNKKEVEVRLFLNEGEPVYVRRINIRGNYETRDYVIRRELRLGEGSLYTGKSLIRSRDRLYRLGYFEEVNIFPERGKDNYWDIDVKVRERLTGNLYAGITYSEITRTSGFIGIRKGNFMGTGDIINLYLSWGQLLRNNTFSYKHRWLFKTPTDVTLSLYDREFIYPTYTVLRRGGDLFLEREFREFYYMSLGVTLQRVEYSNITVEPIKYQEGGRNSRKLFLSLSRDSRDNLFFPTKGSLTKLEYSIGLPLLEGQEKFNKLVFTQMFAKRLYGNIIYFAFKMGGVEPYGNSIVPLDELFFLGGDFSIRGYYYGYAGPVKNGYPIGAKYMAYATLEFKHPLNRTIFFKVFYDLGTAGNSLEELKRRALRGGYGLGLDIVTPVAPIRLEWAFKTKPVEGDRDPSRIHFVIGYFF